MNTIEERVKAVVAKQLYISEEDIKSDSNFSDDLNADSLDQVELIMMLEDEFELEIPDETAVGIQTVKQAVDYITSRVSV